VADVTGWKAQGELKKNGGYKSRERMKKRKKGQKRLV